MSPDLFNGLFEILASPFLFLHVRRVWKDKDVAGCSLTACAFFTAWGWWNLYFYPSQGLWLSFWGGIPVLAMNCAWFAGMLKFRRRRCQSCGVEARYPDGDANWCEACWCRARDAYVKPTRTAPDDLDLGPLELDGDPRPRVARPDRTPPPLGERVQFRFDNVDEDATIRELEERIPETLTALRRRKEQIDELINIKEVMVASRALKEAMDKHGGSHARESSQSPAEAGDRGAGAEPRPAADR